MLEYYLSKLDSEIEISKNNFVKSYYYVSLIRLLQILGSYGYLIIEKKDRDNEKKIFKAITNLKSIENNFEEKEIRDFIKDLTG